MRTPPEPVHVVKSRRQAALAWLTEGIPYVQFLGIQFDRRGDELTAHLPFDDSLIGNPMLPALHGGATIEHGEIGDAARTIDLDVFGARLERHGGANARRMRFQSAELSAMTHEIQQHDGAESAQHGERPAGAFEPNHVSRTPGSNVTIVT